jgi:hypothetical protein
MIQDLSDSKAPVYHLPDAHTQQRIAAILAKRNDWFFDIWHWE